MLENLAGILTLRIPYTGTAYTRQCRHCGLPRVAKETWHRSPHVYVYFISDMHARPTSSAQRSTRYTPSTVHVGAYSCPLRNFVFTLSSADMSLATPPRNRPRAVSAAPCDSCSTRHFPLPHLFLGKLTYPLPPPILSAALLVFASDRTPVRHNVSPRSHWPHTRMRFSENFLLSSTPVPSRLANGLFAARWVPQARAGGRRLSTHANRNARTERALRWPPGGPWAAVTAPGTSMSLARRSKRKPSACVRNSIWLMLSPIGPSALGIVSPRRKRRRTAIGPLVQ